MLIGSEITCVCFLDILYKVHIGGNHATGFFTWGEVTPVTEGKETARPEARAERGGRKILCLFCERASDQTSETCILPVEMSR